MLFPLCPSKDDPVVGIRTPRAILDPLSLSQPPETATISPIGTLWVEDEKKMASFLAKGLREADFTVAIASPALG